MKGPDPNSIRSKRRATRGFVSLERSSRKHRRAIERNMIARTISGKLYDGGEKVETHSSTSQKGWLHTAGGSLRYY